MKLEDLYNEFAMKKFVSENERYSNQLECLLNPYKPDGFCSSVNFDNIVTENLSSDVISLLQLMQKKLVYALIAPAFIGQFNNVTPGKLRSALKRIGFKGMVEVALFADILTLKEALEFERNVNCANDFQLTSCCCPMWLAMIRKIYKQLMTHIPGSVSPMIASGRTIKILHPEAVTVFIGPCLAKRAEAREKDLVGAVDYVLTFDEVQNIFDALKINPENMQESESSHSSRAGRIYARTGGVSEAVKNTVMRLNPNKVIIAQQADGISECKLMINDIISGKSSANFFEGMGCNGGCVGGPKKIINHKIARHNVNVYGNDAIYPTPLDNPYVLKLLHKLGFNTVDDLLSDSKIFTRFF